MQLNSYMMKRKRKHCVSKNAIVAACCREIKPRITPC
ncbi:hypothetical protein BVRB_4g071630 [Beta vulgaris subsp. vulgaris]|nr:hypothetical protein BVRB_4g071630 [Beta vulgaris subsp. vulgaris]